MRESEAALRYQRRQTVDQVAQAQSMLASTEAQVNAAVADAENAQAHLHADAGSREARRDLSPQELDQARTAFEAATAKLDSLREAGRGAALDRGAGAIERGAGGGAPEPGARRTSTCRRRPPRSRPRQTCGCAYTEITAPIDGIVDVRAARAGEYAAPGQPIVTLIDPDDLWIRADVEETYVDRVRIGDKLTVRLPSGVERQGTVFYRGVDAAYATQRDVSRTKRDIKTFEVRLRVDNADRRLAVGMTAYVVLPSGRRERP